MLKRVDKENLRLGMFIESLEGASVNSPLAGRRFLLVSESDLAALKKSNLSGAYINTVKGVDCIAKGRPRKSASRSKEDVEKVYQSVQEAKQRVEELFDKAAAEQMVKFETASDVVSRITETMEVNPALLLGLTRLKSKDDATFLHSIAVSALMFHFARQLNIRPETAHLLGVAGLLHDIGKTAIPDAVLNKPSKLTPQEMDLMRQHPTIGAAILSREPNMDAIILDVCLHHHEQPDGRGYPEGMRGDKLSPYARIAAICDVYDAITSRRPYKTGWTPSEASEWMTKNSKKFDETLLYRFLISLSVLD